MNVRFAILGVIAVAILDRLIRSSITSESVLSGFGSFLKGPTHLQSQYWFFPPHLALDIVAAILVVVGLIASIILLRRRDWRAVPLVAIVLGGGNNVWDRFRDGGVWDYWTISYPWGEGWFNIADVMIIIGVIYWFIYLLIGAKINKSIN